MRMEKIYKNEKVYGKKYNINEIERMYKDAYDFIAEEYKYTPPDIEEFEVEIVEDVGYELNHLNDIKIIDLMGDLSIYVARYKFISGTERK